MIIIRFIILNLSVLIIYYVIDLSIFIFDDFPLLTSLFSCLSIIIIYLDLIYLKNLILLIKPIHILSNLLIL